MKSLVRFMLMSIALLHANWGTAIFGNDFESEILPLLTKVGCNTGACHGAAAGRGGFKLSLFGSDPSADYRAIVLDHKGRRIHRQIPERSLLLMKPSLQLDHGGDLLFDAESATAIQIRTGLNKEPRRASRQNSKTCEFSKRQSIRLQDRLAFNSRPWPQSKAPKKSRSLHGRDFKSTIPHRSNGMNIHLPLRSFAAVGMS